MRAHLSRTVLLAAAALSALGTAPDLTAQDARGGKAPLVVPTGGNQIVANDSYVYVLIGTEVFQLDARTLRVLRSVDLQPVAEPEPEPEPEEEPEEIVEEEVEPFDAWTEPEPVAEDAAEPEALAARKAAAKEAGRDGGRSTRNSIEFALQWLVAHQSEDGKWDADGFMARDPNGAATDGPGNPTHDVGATGLALLALMGDGNTMRSGPHKQAVKKGILWLRNQQDPKTGLIGGNMSNEFIYDHAIASIAMVEAYGLSDAKILRRNAQMALNYLESHRNPYAVWRYQPRDGDNDTSVTSWCTMAWRAGKDFGLEVNPQTGMLIDAWMDQMTDPVNGRTGYTERGGMSSRMAGDHSSRYPRDANESMTAAGLFCRYLVGKTPATSPIMSRSADLVAKRLPDWDPDGGKVDFVGWFFGSYALFQHGGRHWDQWRKALAPALVTNQRRDATFDGSWDPCGPWGESMGRVGSTALGALSLQSAYRYSRLTGD